MLKLDSVRHSLRVVLIVLLVSGCPGPQGQEGAPGPAGPTGPAGLPGTEGTSTGPSNTRTFAICGATAGCAGADRVAASQGPCTVSSGAGSCSHDTAQGSCHVCKVTGITTKATCYPAGTCDCGSGTFLAGTRGPCSATSDQARCSQSGTLDACCICSSN